MEQMYYIGLDVHKKKISYCVKDVSGRIYAEGAIAAARMDLDRWMKTLPQPWTAAMEATIFHGLVLRLSAPARHCVEGRTSADAARHRHGEKEERSDRCQQDRRLPAS
jgi:hypothetical protein